MGNCESSTNCYECYGEADGCVKEIEVDSDVAGTGVIVAFLIGASLACSAVLIGYFMDSLPETLLADLDGEYIAFFQRSPVAKRILPWIGRRWLRIKSIIYRAFGRKLPEQRTPIPRDQRVAGVSRFLLAFSDQQMVSGLAIMTAALANRCKLTFYKLEIVLCLAWFAAMTHLATLRALRQNFYDNPVVRNWRLLGIATFIVLLCFLQVIYILADAYPITPIQCIMNGTMRRTSYDPTEILSAVFYIFIWLLPSYVVCTQALFSDPRKIYRRHSFYTFPVLRWSLPKSLPREERTELAQNAIIQQQALLSLGIFKTIARQPRTLRIYKLSFAEFLCDVAFGMAYGLLNAVNLVWRDSPTVKKGVRRMGFGQVVALMMIAIPLLSATEIYNDTKHPTAVDRYHRRPAPPATEESNAQAQLESTEKQTTSPPFPITALPRRESRSCHSLSYLPISRQTLATTTVCPEGARAKEFYARAGSSHSRHSP
ncbi:uncharacterized protein EI97DRAFT_500633 [Westerdykella ornata]|uniref:Uncharacterized protein n=1 Tax=Westerdykella ornata TaxID=318751 RepID=A0A6A6JM12_WESOR|nr:uncharacterized protein EI97DRAFT_500633 [Westerdykella ornata]KAF2276978.1 hypothetical protein EI97DRAFT_500633 [Westerdykella ornata]